jgi:hypothetical protein
MLHRMRRQPARGGELEREAGAEEVGMQVVGDRLRANVEDLAQVLDRLDERAAGRGVVEVADVRRQERLVAAASSDGPDRGSLIGTGV